MVLTRKDSLDYVIGPEDLLEIRIFELEELSQVVRVTEDGMVSFPLLGRVQAAGVTKSGFEEEIERRLSENFVKDPHVTVFVKEFASKRISVQGAVKRSGVFEVKGHRNLLEMISEAGGVTERAGKVLYVLRRNESGEVHRIDVNLDSLLFEGDPEMNIDVQPGDVIAIPVERIQYVYVDGAVRSPGRLEMKRSSPLTLLQAITAAGGLETRAAGKRVEIIRRGNPGGAERIHVNLKRVKAGEIADIILQDGDIVLVPETLF